MKPSMSRRPRNYALAVSILLFSACTTTQALTVSGESIAAIGETFVATGHLMDAALDAKSVTPEQYRQWSTFAKRFKAVFPLAADAWKAAVAVNDGTAAQHAAAILSDLSSDLASFGALITRGST